MKIKELVISESCLGFPYITEKITGNKNIESMINNSGQNND